MVLAKWADDMGGEVTEHKKQRVKMVKILVTDPNGQKHVKEINVFSPQKQQIEVQETRKEKRKKSHVEEENFGPKQKPKIEAEETKKKKKFKGVYQLPSGRWSVIIRDSTQRKYVYLGVYDTQEEGASAYNKAVVELKGDDDDKNFPKMDVSVERSRKESDYEMGCRDTSHDPDGTDSPHGEEGSRGLVWGIKKHVEDINNCSPQQQIQVQETKEKKKRLEEINIGPLPPQQQEIEVQVTQKFRGLCQRPSGRFQARLSAAFYSGTYDVTGSSDGEEGSRRLVQREKKHVQENKNSDAITNFPITGVSLETCQRKSDGEMG